MKRKLTIATCQFPVSADIRLNESYILKQLVYAKAEGADIVHFSESSLSGYAGIDFTSFKDRDETFLQVCLENIRKITKKLKIWAIVGAHHFERRNKKPFNCPQGSELGSLITGTVRGNAANNYLWISASNNSKRESSFSSFVVRPDGKIEQQMKRNIAGVLISKII